MRNYTMIFILISCLFGAVKAFSQDQADMQAAQAAWMKHMTPGENHQVLARMVGEWDIVSKIWMDPSAPPMESKASATYTMIMGGRYLDQDFKGNLMGMPVLGRGLTGYDNTRGVFMGTWFDNTGTSITYGEGTFEKEKNILHIKGNMTDAMMGNSTPYRYTMELKDENSMVFTMFTTMKGEELKSFEMVYTRKK